MSLFKVVDIATHNIDTATGAKTPLVTKESKKPYKRVTFAPLMPADFADMKMSDIAALPKAIRDGLDNWDSSATEQKVRNIFDFDGLDSLVLGKTITANEQEFVTDAPYTFIGNDGNTVSTSKITVFAIGNENAVSVANRRLAENRVTVVVDGVVTQYTKREKAPVQGGQALGKKK